MSEEIKTSVPNVYLSDLEKIVKGIRDITGKEDTEISFEFLMASLFPVCWNNIQSDLKHQYTQGYIQGRIDKEKEMENSYSHLQDPDDCFCE